MRTAAPVLAAALLAVAALSSACTSTIVGSPTAEGVEVTCRSSGADIQDVPRVLTVRANQLTKRRVTATVSGSSVTVSVAGITPRRVRGLCASGRLEFRPLVAPPVAAATDGIPDALSKLGFGVPGSETAYQQLAAPRRARLLAAIGRDRCVASSAVDKPVVACGDALGTGKSYAALLGPPLVAGSQITRATALAPQRQTGAAWTVAVTLDASARRVWAAYTTAHNVGNVATGQSTTCGPTPCADWVGFVFNGTLLSLPVTESAITAPTTSLAGNFTASTARQLAATLQAGQVPGRLTLVSVKPR